MQHLDEGIIHSWLDGALSADEAARAEAHVAECAQCEAAVAEARGFMAASSRILTALDNAPRGVIPIAAPAKRVNPLVWRVAATVLVVAAGTLVVVQNRERGEPLKAVSDNQPTLLLRPNEEAESPRGSDAATAAAANAAVPKAITSKTLSRLQSEAPSKAPAVAFSEKAGTGTARRGVTMGNSKALTEGTSPRAGQTAVAGGYAGVPTPAAPTVPPSRVQAAAAMDAAAEPERLKVVSSPKQIGAKVTLYEVTPGDTVTLTESTPTTLNAIVLRGVTSMAPQAVGKTTTTRERADAATTAAPESRRTGEVAAAAPVVAEGARAAQVGAAMAVHTIRWTDPATGSTLTLSGRMPEARLQEIKVRIERERAAAAAAAAAKKNP